jgi:hypothetical protein
MMITNTKKTNKEIADFFNSDVNIEIKTSVCVNCKPGLLRPETLIDV